MYRAKRKTVALVFAAGIVCVAGLAIAQDAIPKFLLVQLTRDQQNTICASEAFTQCMGFDQKQCVTLSEKAIETCLGPLPDEIDPVTLQNETLEACPHKVYADAGFAEDQAKACFEKAMAEEN